jgi:hypothetical protein
VRAHGARGWCGVDEGGVIVDVIYRPDCDSARLAEIPETNYVIKVVDQRVVGIVLLQRKARKRAKGLRYRRLRA